MDTAVGVARRSLRGARVWLVTLAAGLWGATLSYALARREGFYGDFLAWWYGARVLMEGGNPYTSPPVVAPYFVAEPLLYPATALMATFPVSQLPYLVAVTCFFGGGAALLGYAVVRYRPELWPHFFGFPFVMAASFGHWAPYLVTATIVPALGFLVAVKPNIALACLASRPSWRMVVGAAGLVLITVIVWPWWPMAWLPNVRAAPPHTVPVLSWLGAPLLLAALRWRRPEGRLLLAMSLLSQTASFADQLVLCSISRNRREAIILAISSLIGGIAWMLHVQRSTVHPTLVGAPYVIASVYLPALVLVLRLPRAPDRGV